MTEQIECCTFLRMEKQLPGWGAVTPSTKHGCLEIQEVFVGVWFLFVF